MEDLINSYNQAEYHIDGFDAPIKIGQVNRVVENLLEQNKADSWCFITAWNPLSVEFTFGENGRRNEDLRKDLEKFRVFAGEGKDPNGEWTAEESFLVLGISKKAAKELAAKYGQRAIVYGKSGEPAELVQTLFSLGNCEIIRCAKTAFLCSRKVPAGVVLKCYDWAIEQRDAGQCVISGFHSTIERDILHYLIKGTQPIILVLARGLKARLEPEIETAVREKRMLIITPFDEKAKRASSSTAVVRNRLMIDLADSICVGFASEKGTTQKLISGVDKGVQYIE